MEKSWLWDVRKPEKEIRQILSDPSHEQFVHYAALLLSRSNMPADVFRNYINRKVFVQNWNSVKRRMLKNKWNADRILFWQEIYRYLLKESGLEGVKRKRGKREEPSSLRKEVGQSIRALRAVSGLTQKELAERAGIHQQVISKIEKGTANPSLKTIEKIAKHLEGGAGIKIVDQPPQAQA